MGRVVLIAVLALACIAGTALATSDGDRDHPPTLAQGAELATAISGEAKEAVAVLSSRRDTADAIPDHLAEPLRRRAPFGANPDLSRLAIAQTSQSLYIVPGNDHICLLLTSSETAGWHIVCPTIQDVAAGRAGPLTVALTDGALAVAGLVPDGIDSIDAGYGTKQAVPVENNTYYRVFPKESVPRVITYDAQDGPVAWDLANPHRLP